MFLSNFLIYLRLMTSTQIKEKTNIFLKGQSGW